MSEENRNKYNMVVDWEAFKSPWTCDKVVYLREIIRQYILEWQEEYRCQPSIYKLNMGIRCFDYMSPTFNSTHYTITIMGLDIPITCDWTVHADYFELIMSKDLT